MMDSNPIVKLSRKHILFWSILISLIFTYAGVDINFFEVITHLDFIANLFVNFTYSYALLSLLYYLHFSKQYGFIKSFIICLITYIILIQIEVYLLGAEEEDLVEMYTINIPFGTLLFLGFSYYYHTFRKTQALNAELANNSNMVKTFQQSNLTWIESSSGKVQVDLNNLRYANIAENTLQLHFLEHKFNTFYSLKQIEDLLEGKVSFFRLNKQFLCVKEGIQSYKAMSDGRIEVLLDGNICVVSKNKASTFRKWATDL